MANSNQFPRQKPLVDSNLMIRREWVAVLDTFNNNLPPSGSGYVIDGSASTYAPMTLFQGLDALRPTTPLVGELYFALDTQKLYYSSGSSWHLFDTAITGDISKPAGSQTATLANVNSTPGTFGSAIMIPIVTINSKGLTTSISQTPLVIPPQPVFAAGNPGDMQYNSGGVLGADTGILFYDDSTGTLTTPIIQLSANNIDAFLYSDALLNVVSTASVTDGQLLIGSTGTAPVAANLTEDSGITITNTPGNITILNDNPGDSFIFNFGDATPKPLFTIQSGKVIQSVSIIIMTSFDDPTSTLSVGDVGDVNRLLATTDNLATAVGTYQVDPAFKYGVATALTLSISPGTSTQGSGLVVFTYQK